jgi:hypothetical protein
MLLEEAHGEERGQSCRPPLLLLLLGLGPPAPPLSSCCCRWWLGLPLLLAAACHVPAIIVSMYNCVVCRTLSGTACMEGFAHIVMQVTTAYSRAGPADCLPPLNTVHQIPGPTWILAHPGHNKFHLLRPLAHNSNPCCFLDQAPKVRISCHKLHFLYHSFPY